jgi:hypothetical protein
MFSHLNLSAMQHQYQEAEKAILETLLAHYTGRMDKSLDEEEAFEKTQKIFHEVRKITVRLEEIKKLTEEN